VSVSEGALAFPPTFVGASGRVPLTLVNAAPVPATLVCDLTRLPDLELLLPRELELDGARGCAGAGARQQ
jgi:hypothetical protein